MVIHGFAVSMRGMSSFMSFSTSTVTFSSLYAVSTAVRFTSPLPCAACESPVHSSAPLRTRDVERCAFGQSRMSMLPAYSPGGTLL